MVVYAFGQGPVDRISLLEVHNHLMTPVYDILIWKEPLVGIVDHFLFLCTHIVLFICLTMLHVHPSSKRGMIL